MTQSDNGLRLIGYVRVSTEEQAREGVSLDAQESRLRAYVEAHGGELVALERDEGVSGKIAPARRHLDGDSRQRARGWMCPLPA